MLKRPMLGRTAWHKVDSCTKVALIETPCESNSFLRQEYSQGAAQLIQGRLARSSGTGDKFIRTV